MAAIDMPTDMPDIPMPELDDEDIDQLDEITLPEAIREARRRRRIRKSLPASVRPTSLNIPPPSPTTDPENQRFNADPMTPDDVDDMQSDHRCVRRRLNDDDAPNDDIFTCPSFFGKRQ